MANEPVRPDRNVQTVTLRPPFVLQGGFNLNGIDATPNGKTLIAVQSVNGKLWRINAATGANVRFDRHLTVVCEGGWLSERGWSSAFTTGNTSIVFTP